MKMTNLLLGSWDLCFHKFLYSHTWEATIVTTSVESESNWLHVFLDIIIFVLATDYALYCPWLTECLYIQPPIITSLWGLVSYIELLFLVGQVAFFFFFFLRGWSSSLVTRILWISKECEIQTPASAFCFDVIDLLKTKISGCPFGVL